MSATFDMTGFETVMADLANAVRQDSGEFVKDEAARLSEECVTQLVRRGIKGGEHTIKKDVASVFMPEPDNIFTDSRKNGSSLTWLYATPYSLTGVPLELDWRNDHEEDMKRVFYSSMGTFPEERKKFLGDRKTSTRTTKSGHKVSAQKVYQVQRRLVLKESYRKFVALLLSHKGRLEASFADTARKLRGSAKVRVKVSRHFPSPKNITRDYTSNSIAPSVTLGSTAAGVGKFLPYVQEAIRSRTTKMRLRMEMIVTGYANSKKTGRIRAQSRIISVVE